MIRKLSMDLALAWSVPLIEGMRRGAASTNSGNLYQPSDKAEEAKQQ